MLMHTYHSLLSHCLAIILYWGNFPSLCLHYIFCFSPPPPFLRTEKDMFGNTSNNTVIIKMEAFCQKEDLAVICWIPSWVDYLWANSWLFYEAFWIEQSSDTSVSRGFMPALGDGGWAWGSRGHFYSKVWLLRKLKRAFGDILEDVPISLLWPYILLHG